MRSLITGCAGFAGSHLAEYLLGQREEVIALVKADDSLANIEHIQAQLRIESADLCDFDRVLEVVQRSKPQRIYHLAALSSPAKSFEEPHLTYQVNFVGTLNLLSAWRRVGMECRFLFVSSCDVYGSGPPERLPLREDSAVDPVSPYAGSKAAAETLALQFFRSYGLPIVCVRPFHHTGPRQSPVFVCSDFARQIAEIELGLRPPKITVGNLKVKRDFSDVRDIVRGYHLLLEGGRPGDTYQLCSGRAVSIESILQTLMRTSSKAIRVAVDYSRVRGREAPTLWGDPSKTQRAVGWNPEYALETTLRDLSTYWQNAITSQRNIIRQ